MPRWMLVLVCLACPAADFQCSLPADGRKALRLFWQKSDDLTFLDNSKKLDELIAQYPRSFELRNIKLRQIRYADMASWPAYRDRLVREAEANPDDALALTLASAALFRHDTARAIELAGKAQAAHPGDPQSALRLAEFYSAGRFADKDKARAAFDIYAKSCPGYLDGSVEWLMGKAAAVETQARMAAALRARLVQSGEHEDFYLYETLWGLEFRTRPPAEHPALRRQIAEDLRRLEKMILAPDARLLAMLKSGAKQAGLSKEEIERYSARLTKEFPASYQAYTVAWESWKEEHKEPEKPDDIEGWKAWKQRYLAALTQWKARFTEAKWLEESWLNMALELKQLDEKAALPYILKPVEEGERKGSRDMLWTYQTAARFILDNKFQAARAIPWMKKAWDEAVRMDRMEDEDDTLTDAERAERAGRGGYREWPALYLIRASRATGAKSVPSEIRAFVERPAPAKKTRLPGYYEIRAQLAALESRRADALTYFQLSLLSREKPPGMYRGKIEDTILDDAREYFLQSGGTEEAFALWSARPKAPDVQLADGRWETPKKTLPSFELSDLSGKTWKLKQLEGKSLLINLWATWCGPCRAELPHFQKLYEQTKDRADIQVLTFNIDEELGLVEPFMQENKFTFPVLAAYHLVRELLDGVAIPQNWLVDGNGKWIATQIGFDATDADWVNTMVKKLESARTAK